MKSISAAAVALCSVACLAWASQAEAGGAKGIRADLPCPYGGAGDVNDTLWSPTTAASPVSGIYPGLPTADSAELIAGSEAIALHDQSQLLITSAIQYVYYSSPIPDASECATNDSVNSDGPLAQVLVYTLAANPSVSQAGDLEVQFNYAQFPKSAVDTLAAATGSPSFIVNGVTYVLSPLSDPVLSPATSDNADFLFNAAGQLLGQIVAGDAGPVYNPGLPPGTSIKSSGTGTTSAPEIDSSSSIAGITLLAGLLAVSRGGRRAVKLSLRA